MGLQRVTLRKTLMANIAFVWFFSSVNSQMALQFECVGTCVGTMGTSVGAFAGMRSDVSLELRQFYRGVITFGAFVGFLEGVAISDVSDELPGCRETRIAFLTSVRLRSRMCIDVVL